MSAHRRCSIETHRVGGSDIATDKKMLINVLLCEIDRNRNVELNVGLLVLSLVDTAR